jgi:hypothetical protein
MGVFDRSNSPIWVRSGAAAAISSRCGLTAAEYGLGGRLAVASMSTTEAAILSRLRSLVSRAARCARAGDSQGLSPRASAASKLERRSRAAHRVSNRPRANRPWPRSAGGGRNSIPRSCSDFRPRLEETRCAKEISSVDDIAADQTSRHASPRGYAVRAQLVAQPGGIKSGRLFRRAQQVATKWQRKPAKRSKTRQPWPRFARHESGDGTKASETLDQLVELALSRLS